MLTRNEKRMSSRVRTAIKQYKTSATGALTRKERSGEKRNRLEGSLRRERAHNIHAVQDFLAAEPPKCLMSWTSRDALRCGRNCASMRGPEARLKRAPAGISAMH